MFLLLKSLWGTLAQWIEERKKKLWLNDDNMGI
jgi:hypothetical protein